MKSQNWPTFFFSSNAMEINNKNNTNNKTHFEIIPFGLGLLMFASYLLQFCLQALESLSVSCIQETISLKAISINLWRENNRKIYRGKKRGEKVAIYRWLLEFHIVAVFEEFGLMERHTIELEIEEHMNLRRDSINVNQ